MAVVTYRRSHSFKAHTHVFFRREVQLLTIMVVVCFSLALAAVIVALVTQFAFIGDETAVRKVLKARSNQRK
jgi:hypothetical protein